MDQRKRRKQRGEAFFRRALSERTAGVSLNELARRHGVSGSVMWRWARKLEAQVEEAAPAKERQRSPAGRRSRSEHVPSLVPVTLASPAVTQPGSGFVVELRCGRAVRVPPQFCGEALGRLVAVLEASC